MPEAALIVPDACALLDVLRSALGQRSQTSSLVPFTRLAEAAAAGDVRFVLPELSRSGFDRNLDRVTTEVVAHGRSVLESMTRLVSGHAALPDPERLVLSGPIGPGVVENWAADLAGAWASSIRREIFGWAPEARSDADTAFARDRMASGLAPCRPGGEGFEDAEIVNCALRLAAGHAGPAIFLSSNTRDFCNSGTSTLHLELDDAFARAGLKLATTWGAALGLVEAL